MNPTQKLIEAALADAFREGYVSRSTYNDSDLSSPEEQWEANKASLIREHVAKIEAAVRGLREAGEPVASIGPEWQPCVKLPITVHVREQRPGEQRVSTREGITPLKADDLIMRGVAGEEYPIGRELFARTYRMGEAAPPSPAPQPASEFDVRRILLAVVPGDGNGEEVYAKSVADVEAKLTEMGQRIEELESTPTTPQPAQDGGEVAARESVEDALMIVQSYGPWGADLNDAHRRQIVLADEVVRLRKLYEMAVTGRAEMRTALRQARATPRAAEPVAAEAGAVVEALTKTDLARIWRDVNGSPRWPSEVDAFVNAALSAQPPANKPL